MEAEGKGRIVNEHWVEDCHSKRTLLAWRKYRVGRARTPPRRSASKTSTDVEPPPQKRKREEDEDVTLAAKTVENSSDLGTWKIPLMKQLWL